MQNPNRLGWVKSLSVDMGYIDVTSSGDISPQLISNGFLEFTMSGFAPVSAMSELQRLLKDGLANPQPQYVKEWFCLYCASPNSINKTHCSQCGAPRSFIIG
jgi:hypothetical protein